MIDLTLARLKRPALADFNPVFGTVVTKTDRNKGGLSTEEVDANMALSYELMREVEVYNSDETSQIEYDAKMAFMGDNPITLTVKNATYAGCTIQITHRGSQPCQIQWNDTEVLDMVRGDILNLIWNETQWDRINNKNSSTTDANGVNYTFVVDSDESLREWAENSRINNQDYTSVLIRRGTWTSTIGVNLTTAGTKVVQGEPGSKLVFNQVEKALYYDTVPTTSDYWMRDVSVKSVTSATEEVGTPLSNDITIYGFEKCTNLTNCSMDIKGHNIRDANEYPLGYSSVYTYGFHSCTNIKQCNSRSIADDGQSSSVGDAYVTSFGYSYYKCTNLHNCGAKSAARGHDSEGTGGVYNECTHVFYCYVDGDEEYATLYPNETQVYHGFYESKHVIGCYKGTNHQNFITSSYYQSSFASLSNTVTYVCADTPEGGFNAGGA